MPTLLTTAGQLILIGTAIQDTSSYMYGQIMEHKKGNKDIKVITVSVDNNPIVPDKEREKIKRDLENEMKRASVLRQYYNKWGGDESRLFVPKVTQSYEYNENATLIITNDPARA